MEKINSTGFSMTAINSDKHSSNLIAQKGCVKIVKRLLSRYSMSNVAVGSNCELRKAMNLTTNFLYHPFWLMRFFEKFSKQPRDRTGQRPPNNPIFACRSALKNLCFSNLWQMLATKANYVLESRKPAFNIQFKSKSSSMEKDPISNKKRTNK